MIKATPKYRPQVYEKVKELPVEKAYRVSGEYDLILITREAHVNDLLRVLSTMEGVEDTKTFISLEVIKE
jgi:transcriptional regulator, AsnC family